MQKPPAHHGVERDTSPFGPFLTHSPSPNPQPHMPHLDAHSSCPGRTHSGRREAPSQAISLSLSGAQPGGLSWAEQEREKERKKGNSHQLSGKRLSLRNATSPSLGAIEDGTLAVGEAVTFCFHMSITTPNSCPKISAPLSFTFRMSEIIWWLSVCRVLCQLPRMSPRDSLSEVSSLPQTGTPSFGK